ncbi:hypothetical protein [Pseudomonas sp. 2FG]|uniref:hypothetical protein n=1 Tax=Pseudomonas sp. 2FG TaxID=2502191 RepID=UPI0010F57B23|nr:hypothetical protein [Pseudomonas sp. 2FG]
MGVILGAKTNGEGLCRQHYGSAGRLFQQPRFEIWADVFSSLVEVFQPFMKINLTQCAQTKAGEDLLYSICHGTQLQAVQQEQDPVMAQYQCQDCSHTFWRDDENEGVVVTSVVVPTE